MNIDYQDIFEFSVSQSGFSTRINLDEKNYLLNQMLSFEISGSNYSFVKDFISNKPSNVKIYIGEVDTSRDSFKLDKSYLDDDLDILIKHKLINIDYPLLIKNKDNFYKFLETCIIPLKIKDIEKINNTLKISIVDEESIETVQLRPSLTALVRNSTLSDRNALIIPSILPSEYRDSFSTNIVSSFFDIISERKLGKDEYLIKLGNVNSVVLSNDISFSKEQINSMYLISEFIFDDANRFEDKLHILRKVMTNYFIKNSTVESIEWNEIFQILKDNYSLFIDKKIDTFFETEQKLNEQLKKISEDIERDIDLKIDELSKQTLAILATIISSFALKINDDQRVLFLGLAILYCSILLIINTIKGFHFSSERIKKTKVRIKESLERVVGDERIKEIDDENKEAFEKLYSIESFQKIFLQLVLVVLFLVVSLIKA